MIAPPPITHGFRLNPNQPLNVGKRILQATINQPNEIGPEARVVVANRTELRDNNDPDLEVRPLPSDLRNESNHFTDYPCRLTGRVGHTNIVDNASQSMNLRGSDTTQGLKILVSPGRSPIEPHLKCPVESSQRKRLESGHPSSNNWYRPHSIKEVQPTIYRTVKVAAPDLWELEQYAMSNGIPFIDEDVGVFQKGSENHDGAQREQVKIRGLARHEHAITACWILQQGQRPRMLWECHTCGAKGGI